MKGMRFKFGREFDAPIENQWHMPSESSKVDAVVYVYDFCQV